MKVKRIKREPVVRGDMGRVVTFTMQSFKIQNIKNKIMKAIDDDKILTPAQEQMAAQLGINVPVAAGVADERQPTKPKKSKAEKQAKIKTPVVPNDETGDIVVQGDESDIVMQGTTTDTHTVAELTGNRRLTTSKTKTNNMATKKSGKKATAKKKTVAKKKSVSKKSLAAKKPFVSKTSLIKLEYDKQRAKGLEFSDAQAAVLKKFDNNRNTVVPAVWKHRIEIGELKPAKKKEAKKKK